MDAKLLHLFPKLLPLLIKKLGPIILGGVSDNLAYDLKLMHFRIALEEWHSYFQKLGNDASDGPDIHRPSVFLDFQEQFRGTVPECDYFASERSMWFFCAGKGWYYLSIGLGRNLRF
jgi:hypothetical protein